MFKETLKISPLALVVPLFSIARDREAFNYVNEVWSRKGRGALRYTGPRLTQSHQTVLFTLANLRAGEVVSNAFDFRPCELLKAMGWSTNTRNITRLRCLLDDLKVGNLRIWRDDENEEMNALRVSFISTFKPSDTCPWHVRLSEELMPLFGAGLTHINLPRRSGLKEGLATFLYGFLSAESCSLPFSFEDIREASGSGATDVGDFGKSVKGVLEAFKATGLINDFRVWGTDGEVEKKLRLKKGQFRVLK